MYTTATLGTATAGAGGAVAAGHLAFTGFPLALLVVIAMVAMIGGLALVRTATVVRRGENAV